MSPRLQHRLTFLCRCLTLIYIILICVLSLIPGSDVPLENISDKYRHAAAYCVFAVLVGCSFLKWRYWTMLIAFVAASGVGIAMEIVQPYFHRSRDIGDAIANSTGAALGCVGVFALLFVLDRRPLVPSPGIPGEG